jgi:hypothetical protein
MKPLPVLVTRPGFEPRQTESESVVLPLYYRAIKKANVRFNEFIFSIKVLKNCWFTAENNCGNNY